MSEIELFCQQCLNKDVSNYLQFSDYLEELGILPTVVRALRYCAKYGIRPMYRPTSSIMFYFYLGAVTTADTVANNKSLSYVVPIEHHRVTYSPDRRVVSGRSFIHVMLHLGMELNDDV